MSFWGNLLRGYSLVKVISFCWLGPGGSSIKRVNWVPSICRIDLQRQCFHCSVMHFKSSSFDPVDLVRWMRKKLAMAYHDNHRDINRLLGGRHGIWLNLNLEHLRGQYVWITPSYKYTMWTEKVSPKFFFHHWIP